MRSIGLLLIVSLSLLSGCGLIEDVDGPRREDFALAPANPQPDQSESPMTSSDVKSGMLMQIDVDAPSMQTKDGALEVDFENVLEPPPVVPR